MLAESSGALLGIEIPESLKAFVAEATSSDQDSFRFDTRHLQSARQIVQSTGKERKSLAMDLSRILESLQARLRGRNTFSSRDADMRVCNGAAALFAALTRSHIEFAEADVVELLRVSVSQRTWFGMSMAGIIGIAERFISKHGQPSPMLIAAIKKLDSSLSAERETAEFKKLRVRLAKLQGLQESPAVLKGGEPWADLAVENLESFPSEDQIKWKTLLSTAQGCSGSAPSKKYLATARKLVEDVGLKEFSCSFRSWTEVAGTKSLKSPHPMGGEGTIELPLDSDNADVLKGLVWAAAATGDTSLAPPIGDLAERCYKKLPWYGPKCAKVGNACVGALALMEGDEVAAQLARLKQRVKQPTGRKMIAKSLGRFADRAGLSSDQVEELGVPTFGLDVDGVRRDIFGGFTATTSVATGEVTLEWTGPDGKSRKSLPAGVKAQHATEFRELQSLHKQIKPALAAQRSRLEQLLLRQPTWPLPQWRKLYVDQPLLSALVRRLIWQIGTEAAIAGTDGIFNVNGGRLNPADSATVAPWHPALRPMEEVLAWRARLESLEITQPFKQAHREIYLLTDAERRTETYSNRFAAHVIRQHQFAALCQQRGWAYHLQGGWDSHNTPTIDLPQWGLVAEYWVEGPGGDQGMADSGIYMHVVTDQVRFVDRVSRERRRLQDVPSLLFSEILRDVDLFVGVASVGNDPTWQDGGPGGRYQTYWHKYSFGDLSETAQTRKAVLQTLLPRLSKIRDRCRLDDKFLVVRGDIRTYKIHLGSGNILMEPNDQYLCIVPDRSSAQKQEGVFLPFEGDATLSIILSKTFLLAADARITDPTIVRQIGEKIARASRLVGEYEAILSETHSAMAYYFDNQHEIDSELATELEQSENDRRTAPLSKLFVV